MRAISITRSLPLSHIYSLPPSPPPVPFSLIPPSRQEKLEQLAEKFGRKASLRESWLSDMNHVLDELDKGHDVHAVDAALKRHEAISADIQAGVSTKIILEIRETM